MDMILVSDFNINCLSHLFDFQLLAETHCLLGLKLGLVTSQAEAHTNGGIVWIQYSIVMRATLIG